MDDRKISGWLSDCGYKAHEYVKKWNTFEVYQAFPNNDPVQIIGLPIYVLTKGERIRFATDSERDRIIESFSE